MFQLLPFLEALAVASLHCGIPQEKKIQTIAGHNIRLELLGFATNPSPLTMAYPSFVNVCFDDRTYKLKYVKTPCSQIYGDILDAGEILTDNRKNFREHMKRTFPDLNKDNLTNLAEETCNVRLLMD